MKIVDLNDVNVQAGLKKFFLVMKEILSEKHFRLLLGAFALFLGRGSVTYLCNLAQTSKRRIIQGKREIENDDPIIHDHTRTRRKGGGRKPTEKKEKRIVDLLKSLIKRSSYGSPDNIKARIYSAMSLMKMRAELAREGIQVCAQTILRILKENGFTKQINRKLIQIGKRHPDTEPQMQILNDIKNGLAPASNNPVLSIDAKAKIPLRNLFQKGSEWRRKGEARHVEDHDFIPKGRKATPYGIYDVIRNLGFVNLGISADTAQFAVESIRRWWMTIGVQAYPQAQRIILLCDGGGSNGYRHRLWKYELAKLSQEIGLPIEVHHYPTGKSRFNPIEHMMFNHISMNWAGQPLTDLDTILKFICSTVTQTGLKIKASLDLHEYKKGIRISNKQMKSINVVSSPKLGAWNYTIYGFNSDPNLKAV